MCRLPGFEHFESNFKARFNALDAEMFNDIYTQFDVDDELNAVQNARKFVANVCKPHTFRPFVKEEIKEHSHAPKKDSIQS